MLNWKPPKPFGVLVGADLLRLLRASGSAGVQQRGATAVARTSIARVAAVDDLTIRGLRAWPKAP